jgi:hypothetical protein
MTRKLPENEPIDFSQLGQDFYRCYFGDRPDVTITELSKILGGKGERKWGKQFLAWIELWEMPCVTRRGRVRVIPGTLAVWFEREANRRQSEIMLRNNKPLCPGRPGPGPSLTVTPTPYP